MMVATAVVFLPVIWKVGVMTWRSFSEGIKDLFWSRSHPGEPEAEPRKLEEDKRRGEFGRKTWNHTSRRFTTGKSPRSSIWKSRKDFRRKNADPNITKTGRKTNDYFRRMGRNRERGSSNSTRSVAWDATCDGKPCSRWRRTKRTFGSAVDSFLHEVWKGLQYKLRLSALEAFQRVSRITVVLGTVEFEVETGNRNQVQHRGIVLYIGSYGSNVHTDSGCYGAVGTRGFRCYANCKGSLSQ